MNEKEKKDFYIATCKCCLLAQAMKNCSSCRFRIGLDEQVQAEVRLERMDSSSPALTRVTLLHPASIA